LRGEASTKLYCLVTEAHVSRCRVEPAPLSYLRITSLTRYP